MTGMARTMKLMKIEPTTREAAMIAKTTQRHSNRKASSHWPHFATLGLALLASLALAACADPNNDAPGGTTGFAAVDVWTDFPGGDANPLLDALAVGTSADGTSVLV